MICKNLIFGSMIDRLKSIFSPYNLAILAIIVLSFFFLSTAYSPAVNSDMTVNVLMAHYFEWPHDVYFWGQNRLGSFIPLIANALIKLTGLSAVMAVSICNYLVITLGFIGFSKLFKNKFSILIFALLWFFPYQPFFGLNVFPLGLSYGLFGFSIYLYRSLELESSKLFSLRNIVFGLAILFALLAAVWVSDLMMITLVILALSSLFRLIFNENKRNRIQYLKALLMIFFLTLIYFVDLVYLKSLSNVEIKDFGGINSLNQVGEALRIAFTSLGNRLFLTGFNVTSISGWILLAFFLLGLFYFARRIKEYFFFRDFWTSFFFLDFVGILGVIFLSHWVLLNELGSWYFVAPYISASIWILLTLEKEKFFEKNLSKLIIVVVISVVSITQVSESYRIFGEYRATSSRLGELDELGKIGVIGNYWESYKFSLANPDKVMSTPHDKSDVRNGDRILKTVLSDRVFLVRDNWLDGYPDSLQQFGYWFKRFGTERKIAGSLFCEYKLSFNLPYEYGRVMVLPGSIFMHNGKVNTQDSSIVFAANREAQFHSLYGPKIGILMGKYVARLYFNQFSSEQLEHNLFVDIATEGGTDIKWANLLGAANRIGRYYEIPFTVRHNAIDFEIRFHENKASEFTLQKIEVEKLK